MGTLLSQILKVEENKVSLVFQSFAQGLRYSREMAILYIEGQEVEYVPSSKGENVNILAPWAMNKKNKNPLLSQSLKVEEKKVSLLF